MDGYDVSGDGKYLNYSSVTLNGKTTFVQNTCDEGIRFYALTLGSGASIVVELSDSVIDYLLEDVMPDRHDRWGEDYADTGVFFVRNYGQIRDALAVPGVLTLGEATVRRFAEHGIIEILPTSKNMANEVFYANKGEGKAGIEISPTFEVYTGAPLSNPTTPEPATATMSLLALAGLAARRRRK